MNRRFDYHLAFAFTTLVSGAALAEIPPPQVAEPTPCATLSTSITAHVSWTLSSDAGIDALTITWVETPACGEDSAATPASCGPR